MLAHDVRTYKQMKKHSAKHKRQNVPNRLKTGKSNLISTVPATRMRSAKWTKCRVVNGTLGSLQLNGTDRTPIDPKPAQFQFKLPIHNQKLLGKRLQLNLQDQQHLKAMLILVITGLEEVLEEEGEGGVLVTAVEVIIVANLEDQRLHQSHPPQKTIHLRLQVNNTTLSRLMSIPCRQLRSSI